MSEKCTNKVKRGYQVTPLWLPKEHYRKPDTGIQRHRHWCPTAWRTCWYACGLCVFLCCVRICVSFSAGVRVHILVQGMLRICMQSYRRFSVRLSEHKCIYLDHIWSNRCCQKRVWKFPSMSDFARHTKNDCQVCLMTESHETDTRSLFGIFSPSACFKHNLCVDCNAL